MQSKIFKLSLLFALLSCFTINAVWQQPPYEFPELSSVAKVASDANGHAFAVASDETNNNIVVSTYLGGGIWSNPPQVIGTPDSAHLDLAMDNSGTALVIWWDNPGDAIRTAHFNGVLWTTPLPNPLDTLVGTSDPILAMNGPNSGVAAWQDNNGVRSSFFLGAAWSAPVPIGGPGNFAPSIAYSANNTAIAGLEGALGVGAANYFSGAWQAPVVLDPTGFNLAVGIDGTGKGLAVWINAAGNVVYSFFSPISLTWSAPLSIISTTGNLNVRLGMTPAGTAVATWVDGTGALFSSSYNGIAWSLPMLIVASPDLAGDYSLSVSDNGNALAVWLDAESVDGSIKSSRLLLGSSFWTPEELVSDMGVLGVPASSLSENGVGFAAWIIGGEADVHAFASATLLPIGPLNLRGTICKNKFAMQTECVTTLTWTPSPDPTIIAYYVRKNGVLVAIVPASGPFTYVDHGRCKEISTYTVTAIDINGTESLASSITL